LVLGFPVNARLPNVTLLGAAALVFGLTGCNTGYNVKVDSMAKPAAENAIAYEIKATNPDLDPQSLRYKEAEKFVKTALSGKGLYEAPKPEMADVVVNLDYGISAPKTTLEQRSEPIYQQVPGRIVRETVQVGSDKSGRPIYSTVTYQEPPTMEYVGEREYMVTVVTYEKYLRLTALENKPTAEGQPPTEVWSVDITSEGESRDLRKYLPVLAAASIEYVGKDSQGQKTIKLKDQKDGAIAFVKKGL
jgi:hypothetical protein